MPNKLWEMTMMNKVLKILEEMGAKNASFIERADYNDVLSFDFNNQHVILVGAHYNDSTSGITAIVERIEGNNAK